MTKKPVYKIPETWDHEAAMGLLSCPGCQEALIGKMLCEVLEELDIAGSAIMVGGAGCNAGIYAGIQVDGTLIAHGRGCDQATGIKRLRPDAIVFAVFGDGDCAAIGVDSLIAAMNRADKFTVFMINNSEYASTGGQIAPTTLVGQKTSTSPHGRNPETEGFPMHVAEMVAQFKGVAYSARGALNTAANFRRTKKYMRTAFEKQMQGAGFGFVEIISACPTQWHLSPVECLDWIEKEMIPEFALGELKNIDNVLI